MVKKNSLTKSSFIISKILFIDPFLSKFQIEHMKMITDSTFSFSLPLGLFLTFLHTQFSSVQLLSRVWLFATPWTTAHQASLSISDSWSPPKPISIESVMPFNHLILCHPLLFLPSIFPSIRVFSNKSALCIRWPNIGVSASTSLLPMNIQDWSPCIPRDSQASSPTPQFKSINSLVLSFLYSPNLTSIRDHWENHNLDEMDLFWQSNPGAMRPISAEASRG